jgi:Nucleotide modification associated domain 1
MQNTSNTVSQYDFVIQSCRDLFLKKTVDYGTSWRVLRLISLTDQIFIKAQRIRTIQEKKEQKVEDDIRSEFIGIINYGIIALIQLGNPDVIEMELEAAKVEELYNKYINHTKSVMLNKNHDYGEAWRLMSQESFTDLILMKLLRVKQIVENDGKTIVSEGIDANFTDIINYAVFALILIQEGKHSS